MKDKLNNIRRKKGSSLRGWWTKTNRSTARKGKLTARERIHFLMDEGSFEELGMFVTAPFHQFRTWTSSSF